MTLPNLIIGGAPKCGTSSLHAWLADHPDAFGAPEKETHYFVDPDTHMYRSNRHIANGLEGYRSFFPFHARAFQVVFESTPSYLYSNTAVDILPDIGTRPKFVFILREPSSQIYSLYNYFRGNWAFIPAGLPLRSFMHAVRTGEANFGGNELANNAIKFGDYSTFLERWREQVGPDRLCVLLFEDLRHDPLGLMRKVCSFAGLDPDFYEGYAFARMNETYAIRSTLPQRLNIAIRDKLPTGGPRNVLRRAYRFFNTLPASGPTEEDQRLLSTLKAEFRPLNRRLADQFSLDLSEWA